LPAEDAQTAGAVICKGIGVFLDGVKYPVGDPPCRFFGQPPHPLDPA